MAEHSDAMTRAMTSVNAEVTRALEVIWARPDAAEVMTQFLIGRIAFSIDVDGLRIVDGPDEHPPPGQYL